jgi:predicted CXXCH cytochrome family protein
MTVKKTIFAIALLFFFCAMANIKAEALDAEFVGSEQCIDCHKVQYQAWQGSHHDMAMKHAKPDSVSGDFDNVTVVFKGKNNRFFQKDDQYWVNIEGPDGKFHDYQIKYTFGFEPLQQYMVEFEDGRVQLIPFAWDSRAKNDGGQRWFHLYPEYTKSHQDYFWTNTGQNWNYMCADCHSTDVKKNFDLKSNSYKTTFSEINVGCEACHGPASEHITWSQAGKAVQELPNNKYGFNRNLDKSVMNWLAQAGKTTLSPEKIEHSQQNLVCAQCHSRHTQISNESHVDSNEFGARYLLSLIDSRLYYPDGQIYDENFVYGSFLQSKMQRSGVVCSNCHDPHSAELIMPEKVVCLQCHQADTYASKKHHNHQETSAGAQCVNCHMPETTYMEIDKRRDHGWHIPRPDLAKKLGTPDTCLSCHKDKDSAWSEGKTKQWFPNSTIVAENHFAPVFSAADQGYKESASALSHIAQNKVNSNIIRASALQRMAPYPETNTLIAIARGLKEQDSNIRLGAIEGAKGIAAKERWRLLLPLLTDSVLVIRAEAALALAPLWQELTPEQQKLLQPALNDYLNIQTFNQDRGYANTNKGNVYSYQGNALAAEKAYQNSIRIEPNFINAYVNLADLYRQSKTLNKSAEVNSLLQTGIKANPDNGDLPYSLGLSYIRNKQAALASKYLKMATKNSPNNAQYHYVYGLSQEAADPTEAQKALSKAYQVGGNPQHLFALCELQIKQKAFQAKQCIEELSKFAPEGVITKLKQQLESRKNK